MRFVHNWLANPNQGRTHFPHNIQSSCEDLLLCYLSEDSHARQLVL